MNDNADIICNSIAVVGTAVQTDQILRWISLAITILSVIISIVQRIIIWHRKAKEDVKITSDEIKTVVDDVSQIIKDNADVIDEIKSKEDKK